MYGHTRFLNSVYKYTLFIHVCIDTVGSWSFGLHPQKPEYVPATFLGIWVLQVPDELIVSDWRGGGSSVLRPRLATLTVSQYSGISVSPSWRSASYGWLVCPSSMVRYALCISIVWESGFPYLAVLLYLLYKMYTNILCLYIHIER